MPRELQGDVPGGRRVAGEVEERRPDLFGASVRVGPAEEPMVGRLMDSVQPEMVDEVEGITRGTPGARCE